MKIVDFLKKHGRTTIEIIAIIGVILAFLQYKLQQDQFFFEQQQISISAQNRPKLEFLIKTVPSNIKQKTIVEHTSLLVDDYYNHIFALKQENATASYLEVANQLLPITKTLPVGYFVSEVQLFNTGGSTATQVRVNIELNRPITSLDVETNELFSIVRGDLGDTSLTLEIDRILANKTAIIVIGSETSYDVSHEDKLVLYLESQPQYIYDENGNISEIIDIDGRTVKFFYDENNQLISSISSDRLGNEIYYNYDANNGLTEFTDSTGRVFSYEYNEQGLLVESISPEGLITQYSYDSTTSLPLGDFNFGQTAIADILPVFPKIKYLIANDPNLNVTVTSNEVEGVQIDN
ncbi:MAG: hypothetical protein OT477_01280 [Chloroflexi bacterium]|nr:hypothetical protein [Chloroflexota bacterium]